MKSLKLKMSGIIVSLAAFIVACGSQVVEFPIEDDPPPNQVAAPPAPTDPGDEPCTDCQNPPVPEDDAGTTEPVPEEDAGQPSEDAGQPEEDAGQPEPEQDAGQPDSGPPPQQDAGKPPSCNHQYACCLTDCARKCHREAVKTKKQCYAYQKCFAACACECKAEKKRCEDKERCER